MPSLTAKLEAVLFWKGEPVAISGLARSLDVAVGDIEDALKELSGAYEGRGIRLMRNGSEVALVTTPEASEIIDGLRKEELSRELGKAGAETLAVVLYKGPVTRTEIEYVRGVNCASVLRSLMIRGLVEKATVPERERSFIYRPTSNLLAHLGVENVEQLPEFEKARKEIDEWEHAARSAEGDEEEQHNAHE